MAKTYTYDDFRRALEESGLDGQFSDADLALARRNPDAGVSLLNYKMDYANATTPEARALANQGAEDLRSSLAGYTAGTDGSQFYLDPMSPRQYEYGEAPTFTDRYDDAIQAAYERSANREPYSYAGTAPVYDNRYDPQIQQTITDILGRGEFTYDTKTDPVYSAYQKQYAREGQRATANAMGEAAAMTGGQPSSWAMMAATQAGDYYASQMADKIPELYRDAYNRYLQEYQMKLSDLSALRGLESDDYAKYRDQLSQYNTDRSFDYASWLDQQQLSQQDLANLRALRADDLDLYKTNLGQYNTDRDFGYAQWLDEISNQRTRTQDEWSQAETAAKYGDYSRLNAKGVDTSSAEYADLVARGVQAAQYGDYSLLNQAGINTSTAQFKEQLAIAQEKAAVGDYSGYAAMGIDTSNAQLMDALNIQAKQATIASTYANMPTEEERALENAYRQAQIANIYAGMPTEEERALQNDLTRAQILKAQNSGSSSGNTGAGGSGADSGLPTVTSGNISTFLDTIKAAKEAGDEDVQTYEDALAQIELLPGYDEDTMGKQVKEYLKRLYQGKNLSGIGGYRISQN